jgi:hypothetical protein
MCCPVFIVGDSADSLFVVLAGAVSIHARLPQFDGSMAASSSAHSLFFPSPSHDRFHDSDAVMSPTTATPSTVMDSTRGSVSGMSPQEVLQRYGDAVSWLRVNDAFGELALRTGAVVRFVARR